MFTGNMRLKKIGTSMLSLVLVLGMCVGLVPATAQAGSGFNATVIGSVTDTVGTFMDKPMGFAVSGTRAYVAAQNSGALAAIDISNISSPTLVNTESLQDLDLNGATTAVMEGNIVYVGAGTAGLNSGALTGVQVTPNVASAVADSEGNSSLGGARGMSLQTLGTSRYALVAGAAGNVSVVNIDNATSIVHYGPLSNMGMSGAFDAAPSPASANHVLVTAANTGALYSVDVSSLFLPSISASTVLPELSGASYMLVDGNYAYISASANDSVTIIDVSSVTSFPTAPVAVITDQIDNPRGLAKIGNTLYVANDSQHITVVDISTPSSPEVLGTASGAHLKDVEVLKAVGNYIYATSPTNDSFMILDIETAAGSGSPQGQSVGSRKRAAVVAMRVSQTRGRVAGAEVCPGRFFHLMSRGSTDANTHGEVSRLQGLLADEGFGNPPHVIYSWIDGIFGSRTERALGDFQDAEIAKMPELGVWGMIQERGRFGFITRWFVNKFKVGCTNEKVIAKNGELLE